MRLPPGKLRCDYLAWVAGRGSHGETEPAPGPSLAVIEGLAQAALELAASHHTVRVAFGPLGAGPDAPPTAERMAAIVRGADAFRKSRLAAGAANSIEEVLVCAPSAVDVAKAKRLVARMAKEAEPVASRTTTSSGTRAPRKTTAKRAPRASKAKAPALDPAEVSAARARADAYSPKHAYIPGEWMMHPKFGVGQVQRVLEVERMIFVLFEDGPERRLVHAR
jgi:hypothetical protein